MKEFTELWPLPIPEIVTITGEYNSGKSTFAQNTGAAPERTAVIDFEKSQKGDNDMLNFGMYIDVQAEMNKRYQKTSYDAVQIYHSVDAWFKSIESGKFDVLVLDNASPLEDALADYVRTHPQEFGKTSAQYQRMSGLLWGDVKTLYAKLLTNVVSKVKMILIVVHLRDKYVNNAPVKDPLTGLPVKEPRGKETLEQLSSLFVWLDKGAREIPSARVVKSRIAKKVFVDDPANPPAGITKESLAELNDEPGLAIMPVLPPRLPKCTWSAIRAYMKSPVDYSNLKPEEKLSKRELSDDDRLILRARIASDERDAVNLRNSEDMREPSVPLITDEQWAELGKLIKTGNVPKQKAIDFFSLHGWNIQRPIASDFEQAKKLVIEFVEIAGEKQQIEALAPVEIKTNKPESKAPETNGAPYPSEWPSRRKIEKAPGFDVIWNDSRCTPTFLKRLQKQGVKEADYEIAYRAANQ